MSNHQSNYQNYRREYAAEGLRREHLDANPWQQLSKWIQDAKVACPQDATSMTLATVDDLGMPAARIVLLKGFDEQGLIWFTDSRSNKGQELADNPKAALLFYWPPLERQVRISGSVEILPDTTAHAYFISRPRDSQLSAAASAQSQVVISRAELEQRVEQLQTELGEAGVEKPEAWAGYRLLPSIFEFWQGRPNRLHDRFRFQKQAGAGWQVDRLAP